MQFSGVVLKFRRNHLSPSSVLNMKAGTSKTLTPRRLQCVTSHKTIILTYVALTNISEDHYLETMLIVGVNVEIGKEKYL
jgi:hypothetical protein